MSILVPSAFREYLADCRRRGLSPETLDNYRVTLRKFAGRFHEAEIEELTLSEVLAYVDEFSMRTIRYSGSEKMREVPGGLSVESIRGYSRIIRVFLRWCSDTYQLPYLAHVATRVRLPPRPRQAPKFIEPRDLAKMIDATGSDPIGLRNKAILCFLADTGCRAGGLLGLTPDRLDLVHRRALVHEKGDRTRPVPFSPETASVIQDWLKVRPNESEYVFCSVGRRGSFYRGERMTRQGLGTMLDRLAKKAGVKGRHNPHAFRHGFARTALTRGMNIGVLAQILGHRSLETTINIYGRLAPDDLSRLHETISPIRHLMNGDETSLKGGENET